MPMAPFMSKFPELGMRETKALVNCGQPGLPEGKYDFVEFYCNEPGCDCRRVLIQVLRADTGWDHPWATINYGWESRDFYRAWAGPFQDPSEMQGPYLDPINAQTKYSSMLLRLFRDALRSPGYIARLERHYAMFRAALGEDHARENGRAGQEANRIENRCRRLRDPRRRRQHVH